MNADKDRLPADPSFREPAACGEAAQPASDVQLLALIEASVFVSPEPISLKRLARAVGEVERRVATLVERLAANYDARSSGLMVRRIAGG
ncbi:MAG: SMC-Scp complex subunit ScpB [Terriglobales bacterium]|jgi:chromosome segregation and condensation protein ScpB